MTEMTVEELNTDANTGANTDANAGFGAPAPDPARHRMCCPKDVTPEQEQCMYQQDVVEWDSVGANKARQERAENGSPAARDAERAAITTVEQLIDLCRRDPSTLSDVTDAMNEIAEDTTTCVELNNLIGRLPSRWPHPRIYSTRTELRSINADKTQQAYWMGRGNCHNLPTVLDSCAEKNSYMKTPTVTIALFKKYFLHFATQDILPLKATITYDILIGQHFHREAEQSGTICIMVHVATCL